MEGPVSCEFDLLSEKWAWVDENRQQWGSKGFETSGTVADSELNHKQTVAYCRELSSFARNLNNGRSCSSPWECVSMNCHQGTCKGLDSGEFCHEHSDCSAQQFCQRGTVWPWTYQCAKLRTSYEQCNETFECSVAHYCWYASQADRADSVKKCLPLYSQDHGTRFGWQSATSNPTFEDFQFNGQYCKSGLAYPENSLTARCTSTDHIKFNSRKTASPYQCDPTNNQDKCQLFFNITDYVPGQDAKQDNIDTTCRCALDGDNGFCGSILGTSEYQDALGAIKPVLERSECHTLDRYDYRAQRDSCGIGSGNIWDNAVNEKFRINYWPYVNAQYGVKDCVEKTFKDSLVNLSRDAATQLVHGLAIVSAAALSVFL